MAARRLLIVMLVLLGISSVIAIVVPEPSERDSDPPETAATGTTGTTGSTGTTGAQERREKAERGGADVVEQTVAIDRAGDTVDLEAKPGSRMILTVSSRKGTVVEVRGLGLTGFSDPYAPAVFDIYLPDEPGEYVVAESGGKPKARIVTRAPRSS
jgi:hypothetical protein